MKRDMELVRTLLLAIERDPRLDGTSLWMFDASEFGLTDGFSAEVAYQLRQLIDGGFIKGQLIQAPTPLISGLTWEGHEFLDAIRDPDVWQKTKERAKGVASVGVAFLWEIAKAEVKLKLGLP